MQRNHTSRFYTTYGRKDELPQVLCGGSFYVMRSIREQNIVLNCQYPVPFSPALLKMRVAGLLL